MKKIIFCWDNQIMSYFCLKNLVNIINEIVVKYYIFW